MGAPDEWLYEYAVVRYVPRVDREEFLNIGLLMMNKRKKWLKGKILLDEQRLKSFFPKVDMDCLLQQSSLFEKTDVPQQDLPIEEKYRWLTAVKSACLQVSPSHPGIAILPRDEVTPDVEDVMEKEFERLFNQLVK